MNARGIAEGTKVEFEIIHTSGERTGKKYRGEFFKILDDMNLIIFTLSTEPDALLKNMKISAAFNHQTHGPISFCGVITLVEETKTGTKFYINIDDDLLYIKKREYFRHGCLLKAEYKINNSTKVNNKKCAETKNISYQGVCINIDKDNDIAVNTKLSLEVWLWEHTSVLVECRVLHIIEYEVNGIAKYELGLLITDISPEDKSILIKYLTESITV